MGHGLKQKNFGKIIIGGKKRCGMNKSTIVLLSVFNIFCITVVVFTGLQYFKEKKELIPQIEANNAQIASYNKSTEELTFEVYSKKVSDYVEKNNIDIQNVQKELTKNLTDGFTQAYNNTHTKEEYEKLEDELPNKIGYLLSSKVLNLASPTISQAGEVPGFEKLNSISISFSSYNPDDHSMKVLIFVNYDLPNGVTQSTDGGVTSESVNQKAIYTVTYNLEKQEYSNLDYQQLGSRSVRNE